MLQTCLQDSWPAMALFNVLTELFFVGWYFGCQDALSVIFLMYNVGFPLRCPCGQHTYTIESSFAHPLLPLCSSKRTSPYRSLKSVSVMHNKSHTESRKERFRNAAKRMRGKANLEDIITGSYWIAWKLWISLTTCTFVHILALLLNLSIFWNRWLNVLGIKTSS